MNTEIADKFVEDFRNLSPKDQRKLVKVLVDISNDTHWKYIAISGERALNILKPLDVKVTLHGKWRTDLNYEGIKIQLHATVRGFSLQTFVPVVTGKTVSNLKRNITVLFAKQTDEKVSKKIVQYLREVKVAHVISA